MNREQAIKYASENHINIQIHQIKKFDIEKSKKELDFYKFLKGQIKNSDFHETLAIVNDLVSEISKYQKITRNNRIRNMDKEREVSKKREEIQAAKMEDSVKTGMIIKVNGTNDNKGYRVVLSRNSHHVRCQKLNRIKKYNNVPEVFKREPYITIHLWEKVSKILYGDSSKILEEVDTDI